MDHRVFIIKTLKEEPHVQKDATDISLGWKFNIALYPVKMQCSEKKQTPFESEVKVEGWRFLPLFWTWQAQKDEFWLSELSE